MKLELTVREHGVIKTLEFEYDRAVGFSLPCSYNWLKKLFNNKSPKALLNGVKRYAASKKADPKATYILRIVGLNISLNLLEIDEESFLQTFAIDASRPKVCKTPEAVKLFVDLQNSIKEIRRSYRETIQALKEEVIAVKSKQVEMFNAGSEVHDVQYSNLTLKKREFEEAIRQFSRSASFQEDCIKYLLRAQPFPDLDYRYDPFVEEAFKMESTQGLIRSLKKCAGNSVLFEEGFINRVVFLLEFLAEEGLEAFLLNLFGA